MTSVRGRRLQCVVADDLRIMALWDPEANVGVDPATLGARPAERGSGAARRLMTTGGKQTLLGLEIARDSPVSRRYHRPRGRLTRLASRSTVETWVSRSWVPFASTTMRSPWADGTAPFSRRSPCTLATRYGPSGSSRCSGARHHLPRRPRWC